MEAHHCTCAQVQGQRRGGKCRDGMWHGGEWVVRRGQRAPAPAPTPTPTPTAHGPRPTAHGTRHTAHGTRQGRAGQHMHRPRPRLSSPGVSAVSAHKNACGSRGRPARPGWGAARRFSGSLSTCSANGARGHGRACHRQRATVAHASRPRASLPPLLGGHICQELFVCPCRQLRGRQWQNRVVLRVRALALVCHGAPAPAVLVR